MDPYAQYTACRERLFDAPYDPTTRDEMLVIGDILESKGDPLGQRIALSEALFVETNRAARSGLIAQLMSFSDSEAKALLGPIAAYRTYQRLLTIDWRGGAPYAARIDLRYQSKVAQISMADLLEAVLKAPLILSARELWVRSRGVPEDWKLMTLVRDSKLRHLEALLVGPNPPPARISPRQPDRWNEGVSRRIVDQVRESHAGLYLIAGREGAIPLEPREGQPLVRLLGELRNLKALPDRATRVFVGRCLWSPEPELRVAAANALVELGGLGSFAQSFRLLLRPNVCANQHELVAAIGQSTQPCPPIDRLLSSIAGNSGRYDQPTRSAAGVARAARRRSLDF